METNQTKNYLYGCLGAIRGTAEFSTKPTELIFNYYEVSCREGYLTEEDITEIYNTVMFQEGINLTHRKCRTSSGGWGVKFTVYPKKKATTKGNWAFAVISKTKAKMRSREAM